MRIVVCDTGPVLHLSEAGALNLLENAGEVLRLPTLASGEARLKSREPDARDDEIGRLKAMAGE